MLACGLILGPDSISVLGRFAVAVPVIDRCSPMLANFYSVDLIYVHKKAHQRSGSRLREVIPFQAAAKSIQLQHSSVPCPGAACVGTW